MSNNPCLECDGEGEVKCDRCYSGESCSWCNSTRKVICPKCKGSEKE
jgi:hypothetical protein